MKSKIVIISLIAIILIVLLSTILCLSQFHFDFSQDYRSIEGYENIVFMDPQSKQCFRLCVLITAVFLKEIPELKTAVFYFAYNYYYYFGPNA